MLIPPPTGYGNDEDFIASQRSLLPKVPKKDFSKLVKNSGKVFSFMAEIVPQSVLSPALFTALMNSTASLSPRTNGGPSSPRNLSYDQYMSDTDRSMLPALSVSRPRLPVGPLELPLATPSNDVSPLDIGRKLVLTYFLVDDTIQVYEPPKRNSGLYAN